MAGQIAKSLKRPAYRLGWLAWLLCAPLSAAPVDYQFDPVHSQLVFFIDHLGFSRSIGRFASWEGSFRFDPNDFAQAACDVRININSLDMGDVAWNRTLLARKWFDAENYPQARFVCERLVAIDASHAQLHGQLTLRGQTRPQMLSLTVNRIGIHPYTLKATAGFSASAQIERAPFGLDALGGQVGATVDVRIEVEGQLAKPRDRPHKR